MLLHDQILFLTGGSTGIGLDRAKAYAAQGAKVVLFARNGDQTAAEAAAPGPDHLGFACDVSKNSDVKAAIDSVLTHYGKLDAIHNNTGIANPAKPLHDTTDAEWDSLFAINVKSILHTTRHGIAALRDSKDCMPNTSSMVGVIGQEMHAVCPADTWTPMLHNWADEQADPAGITRYLDEIHALDYCPEEDVIADACVFLLSAKARFITGHIMHLSGGAELVYRRTSNPWKSA